MKKLTIYPTMFFSLATFMGLNQSLNHKIELEKNYHSWNNEEFLVKKSETLKFHDSTTILKTNSLLSTSSQWKQDIYQEDFLLPENNQNFKVTNFKLSFDLEYKQWFSGGKIYDSAVKKIIFQLNESENLLLKQILKSDGVLKLKLLNHKQENIIFDIDSVLTKYTIYQFDSFITKTKISNIAYNINYEYDIFSQSFDEVKSKIVNYLSGPIDLNLSNLNKPKDFVKRLESRLKKLVDKHWKTKIKLDLYHKNYDDNISDHSLWMIQLKIDDYIVMFDQNPYIVFELKNIVIYEQKVLLVNDFFEENNWLIASPERFKNLDLEQRKLKFRAIFNTIIYEQDVLNQGEQIDQIKYYSIINNLFNVNVTETQFDNDAFKLKVNVFVKQDNRYINTLNIIDFDQE